MSALVLKMTTAASSIYSKKPYQKLPLCNFPNFPNFISLSSSTTTTSPALNTLTTSNSNNHNPFQAFSQTPRGHNITPCAPPQNLRPRFPKCLSASARSSSSGADSQGGSSSGSEPGGLMADMGSENKAGPDWFDSQLYPNQDELLSPLQPRRPQQQQPPPEQQQQSSSKFLTLPTILTLGRVAAVPILINTFYIDSRWGTTATTSIFIAAAITDWLDGYIARKMRLGSAFGAFLDPVADKLMVAATLVLLCSRPLDVAMFGNVPWLLVVPSIAIIGREITMSAVREWAASQNTKLLEAVAVNNLGKYKTATQMIALTVLLATRDSSLGRPEALVASGVVLLYISAGLAVWSLVVYMSKIWKVLLK